MGCQWAFSSTAPGGTTVEYIVDGFGRRVGKKVNGTLVKGWLYGSERDVVAELDGSGAVVSRFVYGSASNAPEYFIKGNVTYRIVADRLGTPRRILDASSGTVVQMFDTDEFGVVTADSSPGFQPFGFAAGLYDPDTGLVHFGARDYSAAEGKWLEPDPIDFRGGDANLYTYAANDPLNRIDRTGLIIAPVDTASQALIDELMNDPFIGEFLMELNELESTFIFIGNRYNASVERYSGGYYSHESGSHGYPPGESLIEWDLATAKRRRSCEKSPPITSAAQILAHELGHAYWDLRGSPLPGVQMTSDDVALLFENSQRLGGPIRWTVDPCPAR